MKISGLDFLSDFEKRLLASLGPPRLSAPLEFHRLLNFFDKTMVLKIGWSDLPLGRLTCRMVEEPQDFYFRGMFHAASDERPYSFTLRPGKDYEKDISLLVDSITVTAKGLRGDEPVAFADAFAAAFAEPPSPNEQAEASFSPEAFFASREASVDPVVPAEEPASANEPDGGAFDPEAFFAAREASADPAVPAEEPASAPAKDDGNFDPEAFFAARGTTSELEIPAQTESSSSPKDTRTTAEILDLEVTITPQKPAEPEAPAEPEMPAAPKEARTTEEILDLEVTITPQKTEAPEEPATPSAATEAPQKAKGKRAAKKE